MANYVSKAVSVTATPNTNPEIFKEALLVANSINRNYLRFIPAVGAGGVRIKKLYTIAGTFVQTDGRDCSWDPTTNLELALKTVTPAFYKINAEECGESWDAVRKEQDFYNARQGKVPEEEEQAILAMTARKLGIAIENQLWSDITTEAAADADVIDVTATPFTVNNILDEVAKVYAAIPEAVMQEAALDPVRGQIRCFMNAADYRTLRMGLNMAATKTNVVLPSWSIENGVVRFLDMEIVPINGITAGTMLAGAWQNFACVSNIMSDAEIKARYGADLDNENLLMIKSQYTLKGSYAYGAQIVFYN